MWINFTFILILCLITFIGFSGYSLAKNNADKVPNRAGLANQLAQLPPNYDGPPEGAMCYDMAVLYAKKVLHIIQRLGIILGTYTIFIYQ